MKEEKINSQREESLNNINYHIPQWAKIIVELYTSSQKIKLYQESEKTLD